jgi:type VI protein secretion system component VasK
MEMIVVQLYYCEVSYLYSKKNHREARWILGMAVLSVPCWVVWCAWSILGAIKTRDAAVCIGLLINATILLLCGPVRKLYLLNKYQALIEEEDKEKEQADRASKGKLRFFF